MVCPEASSLPKNDPRSFCPNAPASKRAFNTESAPKPMTRLCKHIAARRPKARSAGGCFGDDIGASRLAKHGELLEKSFKLYAEAGVAETSTSSAGRPSIRRGSFIGGSTTSSARVAGSASSPTLASSSMGRSAGAEHQGVMYD